MRLSQAVEIQQILSTNQKNQASETCPTHETILSNQWIERGLISSPGTAWRAVGIGNFKTCDSFCPDNPIDCDGLPIDPGSGLPIMGGSHPCKKKNAGCSYTKIGSGTRFGQPFSCVCGNSIMGVKCSSAGSEKIVGTVSSPSTSRKRSCNREAWQAKVTKMRFYPVLGERRTGVALGDDAFSTSISYEGNFYAFRFGTSQDLQKWIDYKTRNRAARMNNFSLDMSVAEYTSGNQINFISVSDLMTPIDQGVVKTSSGYLPYMIVGKSFSGSANRASGSVEIANIHKDSITGPQVYRELSGLFNIAQMELKSFT